MPKIRRFLSVLALAGSYTIASGPYAQAQSPSQEPINKPTDTLAEDILVATARACAAAHVDLTLPQNIVAKDVTSDRVGLGVVDLKWTPGTGADSSVRYTVQTLMLGSDSWSDWGANSLPYNANSFTASGLPLFHPLKFGFSAVKTVTADIPSLTGNHPEKVKCQSDTVYSNVVQPTKLAFQVGVLPATPVPSIPAGDDIILYVHGGPGSRLEEASDLVAPLQREGLAVGKHYTLISFDQISQGYSSMIDPDFLVPQHQGGVDYYPLVQFSESTIVAFVDALHKITPLAGCGKTRVDG